MRDVPTMRAMVQWLSLVSVVALAGCQPDIPPTIFPPPLPRLKIEEEFKAAALTQKKDAVAALFRDKATAILPVFDAEGFFVSLPPKLGREVSADFAAKGNPVKQVLQAVGFDEQTTGLEIGRAQEVVLPQANFTNLAMASCRVLPKTKGEAGNKKKEKGGAVPGLCEALTPKLKPSPALNKLFKTSYGVNVRQFQEIIERREVQFIYPQLRKIREGEYSRPRCPDLQEKVPIEHMGVFARGRKGAEGKVVTGRVITIAPEVTNEIRICRDQAADAGKEALEKIGGRLHRFISDVIGNADVGKKVLERIRGVSNARKPGSNDVALLLLPYGETEKEDRRVPALRYVYRMPIVAEFRNIKSLFYVWLDAEDGTIRELQPLAAASGPQQIAAQGRAFNRDPDLPLRTEPEAFEVNPADKGLYTLQLSGAIGRPDRNGGGSSNGVSIPDNTDRSSSTFANFDQAGLNDPKGPGFEEVDLYATLSRLRKLAVAAGVFMPFPAPWAGNQAGTLQVVFDKTDYSNCTGYAGVGTLIFGVCPDNGRKLTHDHTVVAHEMGHLLTWRQTTDRPKDWCVNGTQQVGAAQTCQVPNRSVPKAFHDFADAWAHAFEDTNCFAGYAGNSRDCATHVENGWQPRKAEPNSLDNRPGADHFPEHRRMAQEPYADMQIAAAALWAVRQGMLSKDATTGRAVASLLYLKRFVGALRMIGWFGGWPETSGWVGLSPLNSAEWFGRTQIGGTDQDIYAGLLDLEVQLANQWAGEGLQGDEVAHTMNKVTAGFARIGVFLVPVICLDGTPDTKDPLRCPQGESGADAVIDIDDGDTSTAAEQQESDYLKLDGNPPVFHVWTGARYAFDGDGQAQLPGKTGRRAPCNTFFEVEVSDQVDSTGRLTGIIKQSGTLKVDVTPGGTPSQQCHGSWPMAVGQWDELRKGLKNGDRIYYRARTWDEGRSNLRISTEPGAGLFVVPPPFAVVTNTGSPEGVTPPAAAQ